MLLCTVSIGPTSGMTKHKKIHESANARSGAHVRPWVTPWLHWDRQESTSEEAGPRREHTRTSSVSATEGRGQRAEG